MSSAHYVEDAATVLLLMRSGGAEAGLAAAGERGRAVAGLGGIRDRTSLALAAGRMRQDPVFRDAVHHFLRRFDEMLIGFEPAATDAEIAELGDTRTARAFMLLGRVTGTFA